MSPPVAPFTVPEVNSVGQDKQYDDPWDSDPREVDGYIVYQDGTKDGGVQMRGGGLFSDVESMKEKLRKNMAKPQYDVSDFYVKKGIFQHIARHKWFEMGTLGVIAFNALWISIDTDHNKAEMLLGAQPIFQIAEHFFCTYFSFEWFCRYMSFKRKRDGLKDAWFVFDSIMVVMMFLETWVMTLVLLASGAGGGGGGMGNASILRLARLLRLSRMMRMAKLLRAMPELLILIKGMVAAMRSVVFTLILLSIIVYVFGIMFTQLLVDTTVGIEFFETVPLSMHTLLLDGTLMDNIGGVVRALGDQSIIYAAIFYIFVLLAALTMMNMLIGVLCEVVSAVASTEKEELTVNYVKEKLQEVMHTSGLDADGDGKISKKEFAEIMNIPAATQTLEEVGIDVVGLVDLSDFIFEKADDEDEEEEGDKQLSFVDFLEVILQLRGTNTATVKDIVDLRKFVRTSNKHLEEKMEQIIAGSGKKRRGSQRHSSTPSMARCASIPYRAGMSDGDDAPKRHHTIANHQIRQASNQSESDECPSPPRPVLGTWNGVAYGQAGSHRLPSHGNPSNEFEQKLWIRAGKLEELLLTVQFELSKFSDVMQGVNGPPAVAGRVIPPEKEPEPLSPYSQYTPPLPVLEKKNSWEASTASSSQGALGHVSVPGVPDIAQATPPLGQLSGPQFEELRKHLGVLEQSLASSMQGLQAIRSKCGISEQSRFTP